MGYYSFYSKTKRQEQLDEYTEQEHHEREIYEDSRDDDDNYNDFEPEKIPHLGESLTDECLKKLKEEHLLFKEGKIDKLTLMVYLHTAASVAYDSLTEEEMRGVQRPTAELLFPDKDCDVAVWIIDVDKYITTLRSIPMECEKEARKNLKIAVEEEAKK